MYAAAQVAPLLAVLIGTNSERYAAGSDIRALGANTITSTAWNSANRAVYIPLYLDRPGTVTKLWTYNGATAAGNIDVGLYDRNYNRLSSAGSTAQAGTSVIQEFDVTDFNVTAGVYFVGVAASLTTTTFAMSVSNVSAYWAAMGVTQQNTALALPNPAVPAQLGVGMISMPIAGIAFRTLVA